MSIVTNETGPSTGAQHCPSVRMMFLCTVFGLCQRVLSQMMPERGLGVGIGTHRLPVARLDVSVPFWRVGEFCHLGASCVMPITPRTREQALSYFV